MHIVYYPWPKLVCIGLLTEVLMIGIIVFAPILHHFTHSPDPRLLIILLRGCKICCMNATGWLTSTSF